jgi:hypothetical protein
MPAIVKLVLIVLCLFVLLPLGAIATIAVCFPRTVLGARVLAARAEILTTAIALGGVEVLAGSVARSYAVIVGVTCLMVMAGMLISDTVKHYRWPSANGPARSSMAMPRTRASRQG